MENGTLNKEDVKEFQNKVEVSVWTRESIRTHSTEIIIEWKDRDELTIKSDICGTINKPLEYTELKETNIKTYGGTQIASACLPEDLSLKALKIGKI